MRAWTSIHNSTHDTDSRHELNILLPARHDPVNRDVGKGLCPEQKCIQIVTQMAENLEVDSELIERALEISDERTKESAVTKALQEFIARREQKRLVEIFGGLKWLPDYDYKMHRSRD